MSGTSPTSAKICGLCGQDCANKPRIKDNAGNYFCKACMEAKQSAKPAAAPAKPAASAPRAMAAPSASGGGYDMFSDHVTGGKKIAGPTKLCTSCNTPMKEDAVVCVNCGYNQQSGKGLKTKIAVDKEPKVRKSREYMSTWTMFLIFSATFAGIACLGLVDPSMFIVTVVLLTIASVVAFLALIVTAFQDGETMWGAICLLNFVPIVNVVTGLLTLFYAFFVNSHRLPKALYGAVFVGYFALLAVIMSNPELVESLRK